MRNAAEGDDVSSPNRLSPIRKENGANTVPLARSIIRTKCPSEKEKERETDKQTEGRTYKNNNDKQTNKQTVLSTMITLLITILFSVIRHEGYKKLIKGKKQKTQNIILAWFCMKGKMTQTIENLKAWSGFGFWFCTKNEGRFILLNEYFRYFEKPFFCFYTLGVGRPLSPGTGSGFGHQ